ncbi:uncharacterized protein N7503_002760 [Penicillium pulvis]|uniref:uncharacterized protein n=1 Tax=Penicillium pulvis TaxID=1562058 RepID=UPI002548285D|nr:uncharacterized protein N7503_002760 [Penicillium pulvis]KAJ5810542.1 hypothetical protein N7503_002760 [Penicillium pulvis]
MKLALTTALFLLCSTGVTSLPTDSQGLAVFEVPGDHEVELEKRRGGGGSHSSGSSGGSSGGRSGSSSSSSGSGSSGSSSSSSGSTGKTGSTSNTGGTTSKGSGTAASYGGGRYYAGGATTPYRAGSSALGITPFLLPVAAVAFFPGLWYHPVYAYNYNHNYNYTNEDTNKNTSLPVSCLCEEYQECGCEDNNNSTYYKSLFNGTQPTNNSVVRVATVNGTEKIYINGTLANGTTAADSSAASGAMATMLQASGYWATAAIVLATVWSI